MDPLLHIQQISQKLQQKLKVLAALQKENDVFRKKIADLENVNAELKENNRALIEQNHVLKATAGNMDEKDKKELETVLNKYIREIDKCIEMLSE